MEAGAVGRSAEVFAHGAGADAVDHAHLGLIGQVGLIEELFEAAQRVGGAHSDQVDLRRFAALRAYRSGCGRQRLWPATRSPQPAQANPPGVPICQWDDFWPSFVWGAGVISGRSSCKRPTRCSI